MSAASDASVAEIGYVDRCAWRSGGTHEEDDGVVGLPLPQMRQRTLQALGARARGRIVQRDDEVAAGGRLQPPLDRAPGLQVVGNGNGAEVGSERRAGERCRGQHGRHAGFDANVQRTPRRLARVDRFEHRRRHGEHAGIAARHDGHPPALGGEAQGVTRAVELDAIVRSVPALAGRKLRDARQIGVVADEVGRLLAGPAARREL